MREISFCSCLTVLPGPAWVLLNKICKPFSRSLYSPRLRGECVPESSSSKNAPGIAQQTLTNRLRCSYFTQQEREPAVGRGRREPPELGREERRRSGRPLLVHLHVPHRRILQRIVALHRLRSAGGSGTVRQYLRKCSSGL